MVFKFRLERVLELRRDDLQEAQKKLADAFRAVEEAKQRLENAKTALKDAQEEMIKDGYKMAEAHLTHIRHWDQNVKDREIDLREAEEQVIRARAELVQAQVKVEALEKLKEKQAQEYIDLENKEEQKKYDEDATMKFARKNMEDSVDSSPMDHID